MNNYAVNLLLALLPEIVLVAGGCAIAIGLAGARARPAASRAPAWLALFTLFIAGIVLQFGPRVRTEQLRPALAGPVAATQPATQPANVVEDGMVPGQPLIVLDGLARGTRWSAIFVGFFLVAGAFGLPQVTASARRSGEHQAPAEGSAAPCSEPSVHEPGGSEFFLLMLFSLAGLMLVASANDLIVLFLAIELASLPTVAMVALSRPRHGAIEAAGKYFFLAMLSTALLLMGLAYIYGFTGQTSMSGISQFTVGAPIGPIAIIAIGLTLAGLAFNIAAFPFHVYLADVYQGAAAPVAGHLAFVAKTAGFVAIIKVLGTVAGSPGVQDGLGWLGYPLWSWTIAVLAVATMTIGNAVALWQRSVKRMLAYSSVAHSGYVLVALLLTPGQASFAASPFVLFYLVAYGISNLGAFLVLGLANSGANAANPEADTFGDLAGLGRRNPLLAVAIGIFGFSLMGLPPTVGFLGKVYIFVGAFKSGWAWLVVVALANAAVGVAYYLRMIFAPWREPQASLTSESPVPGEPAEKVAADQAGFGPRVVVFALAVATVLFGLLPAMLYRPITTRPSTRWPAPFRRAGEVTKFHQEQQDNQPPRNADERR